MDHESQGNWIYLHHPLIMFQSNNSHEKLYTATLDNTRNNNTTCRTIGDIHDRRGLPKWNSDEQQLPYIFSLPFML